MTEPALVLAPIACSIVLAVSGLAKIGDVDGTRAALTAMGVPEALRSTLVARALPVVELALAVLLLVTWGWALALVAGTVTVLFAVYTVLVGQVLRRGEAVDCHCFGSLGSSAVTRWTLLRNIVLVVLSLLATAYGAGGSGLVSNADDLGRAGWSWIVMAALVAAASALVVAPGDARPPADGDLLDYERSPIPFAVLEDRDGQRVTLRVLASQRPQLLVFLSVGCAACTTTVGRLRDWKEQLGPVEINAVYAYPLDQLTEDLAPEGVALWHDVERGATDAFASSGRPAAVLLGADGQLAGGPVGGASGIQAFVADIVTELAEAAASDAASSEVAAHGAAVPVAGDRD